ncbi:hypothetical protein A8F94_03820 [Bacillus sp. FJAT-27225]|uniref:DUF1129 family protein n=1 Tax=Bacillus sp. FJAT-27225 TaxID=1743144 RepID=UPI00080C2A50|nr:DUF1129 family protein [Bacillus sp. FJAT-27225]OCA91004.1 hypothetical protein A8F94_03820 [Bacillus sp. FJAT-27225]
MNAEQLIELNNQKQKELSPENEKIYSDFLIYIRLQLTLSEQQTEEVLMEILDHLLEAQKDGKSARALFGDDPKGFADELIADIPKESKRNAAGFISSLILQLLSYMLVIHGFLGGLLLNNGVNSLFPLKDIPIFLGSVIAIFFLIWLFFNLIQKTLFVENVSHTKNMIVIGGSAAVLMGLYLAAGRFIPDSGPAIDFPWYVSVIIGLLSWGISYMLRNGLLAKNAAN